MSNGGPGLIEPVGPFLGGTEGQPEYQIMPRVIEKTVNTPVDSDDVDHNDAQRRAAAAQAAGHGFIGLAPQAQLQQLQAQAQTAQGQFVQGKRSQDELDARAMLQMQLMNETGHVIASRIARAVERERYRTDAPRGLVEGENVEKSGETASAGGGGGGAGGGGKE